MANLLGRFGLFSRLVKQVWPFQLFSWPGLAFLADLLGRFGFLRCIITAVQLSGFIQAFDLVGVRF